MCPSAFLSCVDMLVLEYALFSEIHSSLHFLYLRFAGPGKFASFNYIFFRARVLLKQKKYSSARVQHRLLQFVCARATGDERERLRLELLGEGLQLDQVVDERGVVLLRFRDAPVVRIDLWMCMGTNIPLPVEVVVRAHAVDECDALGVVAHEALLEAKWNLKDILEVATVTPSMVH